MDLISMIPNSLMGKPVKYNIKALIKNNKILYKFIAIDIEPILVAMDNDLSSFENNPSEWKIVKDNSYNLSNLTFNEVKINVAGFLMQLMSQVNGRTNLQITKRR